MTTIRDLEALVAHLNKITGSPAAPYTRTADGGLRANVGNYHVSREGGGFCLLQVANERGGVNTPLGYEALPSATLCTVVQAYIKGLNQ